MATLEQLKLGLVAADKAGDQDGARKIAAAIQQMQQTGAPEYQQAPQTQDQGVIDRMKELVTGSQRSTPTIEALPQWTEMPEMNTFSMASFKSALGTMLTDPKETVQILKANYPGIQVGQDEKGNFIMQSSIDGKQYAIQPGFRTGDIPRAVFAAESVVPAGQATSILGGATAMGLTQAAIEGSQAATGGEFDPKAVATATALGGAFPAAGRLVEAVVPPVKQAVQELRTKMGGANDVINTVEQTPGSPGSPQPIPSGLPNQNMGSAQASMATQRMMRAQQLPHPLNLTEGQATRNFAQQQFERETAKQEIGAPIRERYAQQNQNILRNFDTWVDQTGSEAPTLREVGKSVDRAIVQQAKKAKNEIRVKYANAEKAGEMKAPVTMQPVVDILNASASAEGNAGILSAAKKELIRLGGATTDDQGNLVATKSGMQLMDTEELRKFINANTGVEGPNIHYGGLVKDAIDQATEGKGGELYQAARKARMKYAQKFENRAIVSKLLNTKRGTDDRAVAYEDVFNHTMLNGSLDDVKHLKHVLTGDISSTEGRQAWKDLQGQTIQWIKDQSTKSVQRDIAGNEIVSPAGLDRAIKALDQDGKLDYLFGKRNAELLRDMNELAKDVYTAPQGSVNFSNTASAVQIVLDSIGTGTVTGIPVPALTAIKAASKMIKNRKIATRINKALNYSGTTTR